MHRNEWKIVVLCTVFDMYMSSPFFTPSPHLLSVCCSMDDAVVDEPETVQNHSSGPDVKFQSTLDHTDQEPQQQQQDRQELEDELLDLDLEDKPSHQDKHKVFCNFFISKYIDYQ